MKKKEKTRCECKSEYEFRLVVVGQDTLDETECVRDTVKTDSILAAYDVANVVCVALNDKYGKKFVIRGVERIG